MNVWAISDLHVGHPQNRQALESIAARPDDLLILGGDVGETLEHLRQTLQTLRPRFGRMAWVPGNHELWTSPRSDEPRGEEKYQALIEVCREFEVLNPEDEYLRFEHEGEPWCLTPMFVLYDYSFGPKGLTPAQAIDWALEEGLLCTDEHLLHFEPYGSRSAWCHARVNYSEERLGEVTPGDAILMVNHFPLHREHAVLPRIPRFKIWCGTTATEPWLERFDIRVAVYGHLHIPSTHWYNQTRFEEVSLGYPKQRRRAEAQGYVRSILPGPQTPGERVYHF